MLRIQEVRPRRSTISFLVLGAIAVASSLAADKPQVIPPLIDQVRVEVVNVDVVVTDRGGMPVVGLEPENFTLLVDGQERAITNFYSFTEGKALGEEFEETGESKWQDRNLKRRMAILFDSNSLDKRDREEAIESLEDFILEQFDGSYEWTVVAYDERLRLLQPFTSDKTTVISALARVKELPIPVRQARATDPTFTEHPVVAGFTALAAATSPGDRPGRPRLEPEQFELRERMLTGIRKFDKTASAVIETMRAYSALPGRKSLVLVTGTLESLPSGPQLLGYGFPGVGGPQRIDPMIAAMNTDLQKRFQAIVRIANSSGFAIYPISTNAGLEGKTPYLDVDRNTSLFRARDNSLGSAEVDIDGAPQVMAAGTGGLYYSTSKFYEAFDDIDSRTANSYVLGFETNHSPDSKYHRIEVKTKSSKLKIQNREGYLHLSRQDRLTEELATPLFFPKDKGDFEVAVQVSPPEQAGPKTVDVTVAGVIPLENVTLIPQGDELVGRIFMFLAVYHKDEKLFNIVKEHQDIRIPVGRMEGVSAEAPARFGLKVKGLDRGDYTFRLTLLDEISDRYGTGLQPVVL
jgi:VWFA-related protein